MKDCSHCTEFDGMCCRNILSPNYGSENIVDECEYYRGE